MREFSLRPQRTLADTAEVCGTGFLTGASVRLRFLPAPPGNGVVFVRTDLKARPHLRAHVGLVTGTARRTTLGHAPNQVTLVEHVLAALAGLHIDNCVVELNAPEPPGLDGSCRAFVEALNVAGAVTQSEPRPIFVPQGPVVVASGNASLALHPAETPGFIVSYFLDYGVGSPIARQVHTQTITAATFASRIAPCRTFLLEAEAEQLRNQGLGSRTTTADLLVFGPHGPIGNKLRFANEPARHKVLDIVGDLALTGVDLCGHVVACRSGHPLNVELARAVHAMLSHAAFSRLAA